MTSASPPLHSKLYLLALPFSLCFPCSFLYLPIASSIVSTLECLVLSITILPIASSIRCLVPSRANLQFCVVVEAFKLLVTNARGFGILVLSDSG
jgi:hypothetical protein